MYEVLVEYHESDVPNILPKIENQNSEEAEEDDEFFDAKDQWDDAVSLAKWSSMELEHADLEATPTNKRVI